MAQALTKDQALSRLGSTRRALLKIKTRTERLVVSLGVHFGSAGVAYAVGRLRGWAAATGRSLNIPRTPLPIPMTIGVVLAVVGASPLVSEGAGIVLQAIGTGMVTADAALLGYQHQSGTVVFGVPFGGGGGAASTGPGMPVGLPDAALPPLDLPPMVPVPQAA